MSNLHRHLLLATLSTLDFPRHLLHRLRIITCRRKFKNSRRRIRYCLVVFTNSNQEDHQVQQTLVVALQAAERVHFPTTASANLLVEVVPIVHLNRRGTSNSHPTLDPPFIRLPRSATPPSVLTASLTISSLMQMEEDTFGTDPTLSGSKAPGSTRPFGVKQITLSNPRRFLLTPRAPSLPAMTAKAA